jgi:hypothetical protein
MSSKFAAAAPESEENAASRSTALDAELAALRSFKATILEKLPEQQVGAVWWGGTHRPAEWCEKTRKLCCRHISYVCIARLSLSCKVRLQLEGHHDA